jgi:hypothetical protein
MEPRLGEFSARWACGRWACGRWASGRRTCGHGAGTLEQVLVPLPKCPSWFVSPGQQADLQPVYSLPDRLCPPTARHLIPPGVACPPLPPPPAGSWSLLPGRWACCSWAPRWVTACGGACATRRWGRQTTSGRPPRRCCCWAQHCWRCRPRVRPPASLPPGPCCGGPGALHSPPATYLPPCVRLAAAAPLPHCSLSRPRSPPTHPSLRPLSHPTHIT